MWSAGKEQQQQHIYNTLFREVKYPRENLILMYRAYWLFFIQILFFLSFLFLRLLHVCNRRALSWQTQQHKRHTHAWRDPLINQYFNQLIYAVCIIPDVTDSRKKQTHTHTENKGRTSIFKYIRVNIYILMSDFSNQEGETKNELVYVTLYVY
jgi:hypothetical protein